MSHIRRLTRWGVVSLFSLGITVSFGNTTSEIGPDSREDLEGRRQTILNRLTDMTAHSLQARETILKEFNLCWDESSQELEKYFSRLASEKEIKDNLQKIQDNDRQIKNLKSITRGEFEEREDFANRQKNATKKISLLTDANVALKRANERLRISGTVGKSTKPEMKLNFMGHVELSGSLSTNAAYIGDTSLSWKDTSKDVFSFGRFDIDNKTFPCTIAGFEGGGQRLYESDRMLVKISVEWQQCDIQLGPFNSAGEARTFKQNVMSGKQRVDLIYEGTVAITKTVERVMVKPETTVTEEVPVSIGVAALGLAAYLGGLVDASAVPTRDYRRRKVPAVYDLCEVYHLDWKLRIRGMRERSVIPMGRMGAFVSSLSRKVSS